MPSIPSIPSLLACTRRAVVIMAASAAVAGCASSPPTNFYTLAGATPTPATTPLPKRSPLVVALGPVTLPDYVDRPQIVTRESAYAVKLAPYDQWAGPLSDMVPRVLVEGVAAALPGDRVVGFPQVTGAAFDYRIAVEVTRFDADQTGNATLIARWQTYDATARRVVLVADDTFTRPMADSSYEAIVAALSGTLADLAGRLAESVETAAAMRLPSSQPPHVSMR